MYFDHEIEQYKNILKPCPFCGGHAVIKKIGNQHTRTKKLEIACIQCHIKKTAKVLRLDWEWLESKLIEDWNTRFIEESTHG